MRLFSRSACRIAATDAFRSSVFPGCALGDVRLQVAQQELRVDRLALVLLGQRVDELADRAAVDAHPERDCGAGSCTARVGDRRLRVGDRAEVGRVDHRPVRAGLEDERRPERRAHDHVRSGRREPADMDSADGDAGRDQLRLRVPLRRGAASSSWSWSWPRSSSPVRSSSTRWSSSCRSTAAATAHRRSGPSRPERRLRRRPTRTARSGADASRARSVLREQAEDHS